MARSTKHEDEVDQDRKPAAGPEGGMIVLSSELIESVVQWMTLDPRTMRLKDGIR